MTVVVYLQFGLLTIITASPPLRLSVFRHAHDLHTVLLTAHHIIVDRRAVERVLEDVGATLAGGA